jgi:hypothetical protein|tara:strand:- start:2206 stop:2388 length:183 start_codon:yes stop_codon:yes gene_type:complete
MHLTISCLLQLGQLNTAVPLVFAVFFLHDEHTNFSFGMVFRIGVLFIKVIVCKVVLIFNN